jgi:hypothetical protein
MITRRTFKLSLACLASAIVLGGAGLALPVSKKLWECNHCRQQYQGDFPPAFAKCPGKDNKENHWWVQKFSATCSGE